MRGGTGAPQTVVHLPPPRWGALLRRRNGDAGPHGVNAVGDDDAGGCNRREGGNGSGVDNDMDCPDGDFNKSIQEDDRGYDCKMVCLAGC